MAGDDHFFQPKEVIVADHAAEVTHLSKRSRRTSGRPRPSGAEKAFSGRPAAVARTGGEIA